MTIVSAGTGWTLEREISTDARSIGDLMMTFDGRDCAPAGRACSPDWTLTESQAWKLWEQPTSPRWKGSSLVTISNGAWDIWLLGEIYKPGNYELPLANFVFDIVAGIRTANELNGRFLLFAWGRAVNRWHVWTDRFGTMHAYYCAHGSRVAISTRFSSAASAASHRHLDWLGLAGFFAFGFFPQDRTYFSDIRVLRPATHYVFDDKGCILQETRYWQWQ